MRLHITLARVCVVRKDLSIFFIKRVNTSLYSFKKGRIMLGLTGVFSNEPRYEKTGLRGFLPGPTQTGLYSHRRWLEA